MIRFAAGDAGIVDLSWSQIEALCDQIDRKGFPPEILEVKRAIAAADENCMKLCVLFGGIVDQSAVNECVRLRRLLDETYAKLAAR